MIDPETNRVFYVGKETRNRIFAHNNAAIVDAGACEKLNKMRELRPRGIEVRHVIHRHGLTEKEAFEIEAALIDFIRVGGLPDQVQGLHSDEVRQITVAEVIAKYAGPFLMPYFSPY